MKKLLLLCVPLIGLGQRVGDEVLICESGDCENGYGKEIAYVPAETFDEIELDAELVELLQSRAKEAALTDALKQQENIQEPSADLLTMEGMTSEIAYSLAARGIITVDDLADQATDDISDIEGLGHEKAGQLIMKARESWFN